LKQHFGYIFSNVEAIGKEILLPLGFMSVEFFSSRASCQCASCADLLPFFNRAWLVRLCVCPSLHSSCVWQAPQQTLAGCQACWPAFAAAVSLALQPSFIVCKLMTCCFSRCTPRAYMGDEALVICDLITNDQKRWCFAI
jgi:hypothetical protein